MSENIGRTLIAALMKQGYNVTVNHYGNQLDHCVTVQGAFFTVAGGFHDDYDEAVMAAVEKVREKEKEIAATH